RPGAAARRRRRGPGRDGRGVPRPAARGPATTHGAEPVRWSRRGAGRARVACRAPGCDRARPGEHRPVRATRQHRRRGSGTMTPPTDGTRRRSPLLALREVSKNFGAVEALVGIDLEVYSHEVVALVGDNGAGKSTLAKVVAGVLTPDAGQVEIDGRP